MGSWHDGRMPSSWQALRTCWWFIALTPCSCFPDVFSCPPTSKFLDRAQRIPLEGDKFLPAFASVAPQKRTPVCELNQHLFLTNKQSTLNLQDFSGHPQLSENKKLWESFRFQTTHSYHHTVFIVSDQNLSLSDQSILGGGLKFGPSINRGDPESWWLSEADDGSVFIAGNSSQFLSVRDGQLQLSAVKDASAQWLISLPNGKPACNFVEPTVVVVTLPGAYRETEWHFHDMGRIIRAREANAGVRYNAWDMQFARRLAAQSSTAVTSNEHQEKFAGVPGSTAVVSVAFGDKRCSAAAWAPHLPGTGEALLWTKPAQWIFSASSDGDVGPSSIEAIDITLKWVKASYASVKLMIVTGFSAGGVIGLRWAIASPLGENGVYTAEDGSTTPVRIILGGLGSYEYLNHKRPSQSCCQDLWPKKNTSVCHSCSTFLVPQFGRRRRSRPGVPKACHRHYDVYPFGFKGFVKGKAERSYHRLVTYLKSNLKPDLNVEGDEEAGDEQVQFPGCSGKDFDIDFSHKRKSPILGSLVVTGIGPDGTGNPYSGSLAGEKALLFSKSAALTLAWEAKVTKLLIQFSAQDGQANFSTDSKATVQRPMDEEIELTDDRGFTSVTMTGVDGIFSFSGYVACPQKEVNKELHWNLKHYGPAIRKRFATKDVRFLLGEYDSVSCIPGACDQSCVEEIQGADRLQRGLNYMSHLREALPGYVPVWGVYHDPQYFRHYHFGAWMSSHFQSWAFLEREPTKPRSGPAEAWRNAPAISCPVGKASEWLLEHPDRCHTPDTCAQKCSKDPYCKGYSMHTNPADGKCWLFSSLDVGKCEPDSNFTLYYIVNSATTATSTTAKSANTMAPVSNESARGSSGTSAQDGYLTLRGDYESVVGSNKALFLSECSVNLAPLRCLDVRAGSIVVKVEGLASDIADAKQDIQITGFNLPSFPSLTALVVEDENEDAMRAGGTTLGPAALAGDRPMSSTAVLQVQTTGLPEAPGLPPTTPEALVPFPSLPSMRVHSQLELWLFRGAAVVLPVALTCLCVLLRNRGSARDGVMSPQQEEATTFTYTGEDRELLAAETGSATSSTQPAE